jgi:hypothetical protein
MMFKDLRVGSGVYGNVARKINFRLLMFARRGDGVGEL